MDIPDCYDPVYQEERRQAALDRREAHFPVCGCCGHRIYGGEKFFPLNVQKETLIVCEDCMGEAQDNVCTVEDVLYG